MHMNYQNRSPSFRLLDGDGNLIKMHSTWTACLIEAYERGLVGTSKGDKFLMNCSIEIDAH